MPSGGTTSAPSGGAPSPTPYTLTNDSYIQVPGSDKPVKYSDFINGYVPKPDFTRAQQRVAAERDALKQQMAEQERKFTAAAQTLLQRMQAGGPQGNAQPDPNSLDAMLSALESAPYVDGASAAKLFRGLVQQMVLPVAQQMQQRDSALQLLARKLQMLDGTVGTLATHRGNEDFDAKMARFRSEQNLPDSPAVNELLRDIYLSHEGNDLDTEFPRLVKERLDAIRQFVRDADRQESETARAQRLGIPGRGGVAAPGRALRRGFQSAAEIADALWPGGGSDT